MFSETGFQAFMYHFFFLTKIHLRKIQILFPTLTESPLAKPMSDFLHARSSMCSSKRDRISDRHLSLILILTTERWGSLQPRYQKLKIRVGSSSRENFVTWVNLIINRVSRSAQIAEDCDGELQEGCYERLTCSDLQWIISVFVRLSTWREACIANNCSAGKFYTMIITGNAIMSITRQKLGPFVYN